MITLKWIITLAFLLFFFGWIECLEASNETKIIRRKVLRRKLDLASSQVSKENATVSVSMSTSSNDSPKSTTYLQSRRALFTRLHAPLYKNRSLDKIRSQLGVTSTTAKPTQSPTKKYFKKILKKSQKPITISSTSPTTNSSMIMIPVPMSQRKPYQPVIMQVTKSNESVSSTVAPETRVVTYKLNKMFVPIGIYGKVIDNATKNDNEESKEESVEIRHKGTETKSSSEKKGRADRLADTIDITYNYKPDVNKVSLTTEKIDPYSISITNDDQNVFGSVTKQDNNNNRRWGSQINQMKPPTGTPTYSETPSYSTSLMDTISDTLKQTASNLPSYFHKGLTSLTSLTQSYQENPFKDDSFAQGSELPSFNPTNKKVNQKPTQQKKKLTPSEFESLEYFRNRPHLFGRDFKNPKTLSGFRPVTAPPHLAEAYFASTPSSYHGEGSDNYEHKSSWRSYLFDQNNKEASWKQLFQLNSKPSSEEKVEGKLESEWTKLTSKYSTDEIEKAKDELFNSLSRPQSRSLNLNSPIQNDLFNIFKLYFNVETNPLQNNSRSDHWQPINRLNSIHKQPVISFSAGVTFPTFPTRLGSHYSASPKPFIPQKFGLSNHMTHHFNDENFQTSASENVVSTQFNFNSQKVNHEKFTPTTMIERQENVNYDEKINENDKMSESSIGLTDDSPYELIPSDVYFNQKNPNLDEIAAVVKPDFVSEELLKSKLPSFAKNVPTFNYNSLLNQGEIKAKSLSDLYLSTQRNKDRADIYKTKEASFMLPQTFYDQQINHKYTHSDNVPIIQQKVLKTSGDSELFGEYSLPEMDPDIAALLKAELDKDDIPLEIRNEFKTQNQNVNLNQQIQPAKMQVTNRRADTVVPQFQQWQPRTRNYLFNSNLFQHAQNQNQRQFQISNNFGQARINYGQNYGKNYPSIQARPMSNNQRSSVGHTVKKPIMTRFFAPIPISPTQMSQTLRGRYQSPVPRYVIELAKKLQRDKDVQGIVRVSTKRAFGPPIEYLYPVRG